MNDRRLSRSHYQALVQSVEVTCSGCLDMNPSIFDYRAVSWATSYPKLSPQKVILGTDSGCVSCTIIDAAFQSVGLDLRTSHDVQLLSLFHKDEKGSLLAMAQSKERSRSLVEMYTVQDSTLSPWSIINHKTHLSGNTASAANLQRIQQWIYECENGHNMCSKLSDIALPTRLLDLGVSNDSIRLVETTGLTGPYICLSHCWGESSTILCTKETYGSYENNIPWISLPLLFRNTIEICRMLEVRYLWIDKLCIIQHDNDDWAREGSRMAQIFEGSFLTIGATMSKDDSKSLFFREEKHDQSSKNYTVRMEDGTSYTVYFRIPFNYHPAHGPEPGHEEYPLMTRAWIYQERLLAPRILYFGEELSWECREASACECSDVSPGMKFDHSLSLMPDYPITKRHLQWQRMVEEFTWLQLSYEGDRLPAFSGLAQQYQNRLKSEYLAGIWRENLGADLLWYARPELGSEAQRYYTKKPVKWRAPSWSWASIEGPILFSKTYHEANAEAGAESATGWVDIISAECIPSSLDPMGSVAKGQLVIKGGGRPALLNHREVCSGRYTRHFSVTRSDVRSMNIRSNFTVEEQEANVDYDLIEQGLMKPNSDTSIYCLYIAGMPFTQRVFRLHQGDYISRLVYRTWALLLHCVDGNDFERIGLLVSDHFDRNEVHLRNSLNPCIITIV